MTEYSKIKCEKCEGTGKVPRSQGIYTMRSNRRERPRCYGCGGFGYNMIGKRVDPVAQGTYLDRSR